MEEQQDDREVIDLISNLLVHSQILIDDIDSLGDTRIFKHSLKNKAKSFQRELEKTSDSINDAVDVSDNRSKSQYLQLYDDYFNIMNSINKLTIEERASVSSIIGEFVAAVKNGGHFKIVESKPKSNHE